MTINITDEMLNNHSDAEIVAFLDSAMAGVLKNYRMAIKQNQPEVLYGNLGDIALVANVIRAMRQRNDAIEAQKQM